MENIKLTEASKKEYQDLVATAQNIDFALGGAQYKLYKMNKMREQVDLDLKTWWEKVSDENNIDKSKDYFVTQDGEVSVVDKPAGGTPNVGTPTNEPNTEVKSEDEPKVEDKEVSSEQGPASPTEDVDVAIDNKEGGTSADLT